MDKNRFNESLVDVLLEEEAWKELSGTFAWTETLLGKYRGKLDWEQVSRNGQIRWTPSMLERFKNAIDWKEISRRAEGDLLQPEVVERFKDCWDWKELSSNTDLPVETIERMADLIDWRILTTARSYSDGRFSRAFFDKWADRIPADAFRDSAIWCDLVEERGKEISRRLFLEQ